MDDIIMYAGGAFALIILALAAKLKKKRQKRRFKIRPINRSRRLKGGFNYYKNMKALDADQFFKFTRMNVPVFQQLLKIVKPRIAKNERSDGISAEERLVITLQ